MLDRPTLAVNSGSQSVVFDTLLHFTYIKDANPATLLESSTVRSTCLEALDAAGQPAAFRLLLKLLLLSQTSC